MRRWSHIPEAELFPTPFNYEFATLQVRTARRQTLNFELSAEAHFQSRPRGTDVAR